MAQQVSILQVKGKVGNVVGFKNSASLKTNNNFLRAKASSVANPRTYRQAKQRSKSEPAKFFYAAFVNVLNHAFKPLERASRNRNAFMSAAMKLDEVPDVQKGEVKLPLVGYQVSKGSLGCDAYCVGEPVSGGVAFGLKSQEIHSSPDDVTVADVSSDILGLNLLLTEGMELTFLATLVNKNDNSLRLPVIISFVLDQGNTVTYMSNVIGNENEGGVHFVYNEDSKVTVASYDGNYILAAAALIISSKTSSSYRYTNSYMVRSVDGGDIFAGMTKNDVITSYMNSGSGTNSDLILQQADNTQQSGDVVFSFFGSIGITLAEGVTGALSSQNCAVAVYSNGNRKVVIDSDGTLGTVSGNTFTAITITPEGGTARNLNIADTTLWGNDKVEFANIDL